MQAGNGCGTNSAAQGLQICHCEAPKGPWQSREGSHDFVGTCLLSTRVLRDFHVASLPGMTNLGVSRHKIHTSNIASLQGGHSPQGHAASVRPQSRQRLRSERRYRRNRCAPFYRQLVRAALPSRDCHVGLRPPRNDKSGAVTILTIHCANRPCSAGPGCPLPYKVQPGRQYRYCYIDSDYSIGQGGCQPGNNAGT